jgi:hypothetical protein
MPINDEQQCIMRLGEWDQYCSGVDQDHGRANRLMAWDYVCPGCSMRPFVAEDVVASMINDGGWAIIGDSLSREVPPPDNLN